MRSALKNCERIVVKVGTSTLMYDNGNVNLRAIEKLARVLADLKNEGKEVILVSSGAIGVGCHKLNLSIKPQTIPEKQAVAAVGQTELMHLYSKFFGEYGYMTGQVLLTRDVTDFPQSRENVVNTLETLLKKGIIPIVNENDTVAVEEIEHLTKYGDNDRLSAIVTKLIQADILIMLSDIDGFYEENPLVNPEAKMFHEITAVTPALKQLAGGEGTVFGTGGMYTKLLAAEYCLAADKQMLLINGQDPALIFAAINGEMHGTLFSKRKQMIGGE